MSLKFKTGLAGMAFAAALASAASSPRKVVALGWQFHGVDPKELLANADAFEETGLDGVEISLNGRMPDGKEFSTSTVQINGRWRKKTHDYEPFVFDRSMFEHHIPVLRELVKRPCFRHSFLVAVYRSPRRYGRLDWRDDAAWARVATNSSVLASIARDGGVKGLVMDCEDYFQQSQYRVKPGDPPFDEASRLARQRGSEVFGAVFRAHPEATVLSFWLLSWNWGYFTSEDPLGDMRESGDLWPSFVNGVIDAMPPTATLVDGDEKGYGYDFRHGDFAASAYFQGVKALELVAPENREKYRRQVRIGFGLYLDRYVRPSKIGWFGKIDGTPGGHFRRNFSDACRFAQEYVWLWGEKRSWVKWNLWTGKAAKKKNYERTWEDDMPGMCEAVRFLKSGESGVERKFEEMRSAGALTNLVAAECMRPDGGVEWVGDPPEFSIVGVRSGKLEASVKGVKPGDWYAVEATMRGVAASGHVRFRAADGTWCAPPGGRKGLRVAPSDESGEVWRRGRAFVCVPPGSDELVVWLRSSSKMGPDFFTANGPDGDKSHRAAFKDVAIYKVFQ